MINFMEKESTNNRMALTIKVNGLRIFSMATGLKFGKVKILTLKKLYRW